jgi:hypothetical protein
LLQQSTDDVTSFVLFSFRSSYGPFLAAFAARGEIFLTLKHLYHPIGVFPQKTLGFKLYQEKQNPFSGSGF